MSRALAFLMRPLDVAVIFAYFVAVMVFGLLLAGRQRDATDYFLGHRGLPWWALMLSVVATETSAVTGISHSCRSPLVIWWAGSASQSSCSQGTSKAPKTPLTNDSSDDSGELPDVPHPVSSS